MRQQLAREVNRRLRLEPAPDRQPARHTWRDGSVEIRIVQRPQEGNQIALAPAAHVQPARQGVNLIPAQLWVHVARAPPASSSAATDPTVEVEHVWQGPEDTVVHVGSRRTEVTQGRRAEGVRLVHA